MKRYRTQAGSGLRPARSRGVAALEFMLILMILLPAFYVAVAFSITILARQMLTQAAAEGGRAMLRAGTLAQRQSFATQAIGNTLAWPASSAVSTTFVPDTTYPCPASGASSSASQCIVHVNLSLNQTMTVNWPGLGSLVPSTINGTTAVTLDTSTLGGS
ncbi:TadE family protein [Pandoraea iniqua]|uniref:TadE family protein n=2 Tax=Pandoraea iniqua TaxID=2508288 RepID=A0A5E4W5Q8_9BURK|nr:TadE/TadG family type IV pilus assembly protein [Pandoraea iniqua]VVE11637.1 TadE family protein [Pandoraea iniqua]VVE19741.1 TadE family protein [Pandoraea iniqua]